MTIRDMVRDIQREVGAGQLEPSRAAELLGMATALIGNCNDEIRLRDVQYAAVLLQCLDTSEHANRAKIQAECSAEYQRKREARDTKELITEVVRSLKYILKAQGDEMRLAR